MAVTPAEPKTLPLPTLLRTAFLGYCPNCLFGKLFDGLLRPKPSCAVCGMPFELHGGTFTMTAFILYILICGFLVIEGAALALLFGFFPGYAWVLGASAAALYLALNRPVRGLWVWCLWRLGYLG
jgi:uncharacterized protein (DUF983 family)